MSLIGASKYEDGLLGGSWLLEDGLNNIFASTEKDGGRRLWCDYFGRLSSLGLSLGGCFVIIITAPRLVAHVGLYIAICNTLPSYIPTNNVTGLQ